MLIKEGFAPQNAGALLNLHGGLSMLPMLMCALTALGLCAAGVPKSARPLTVAGAVLCGLVLCLPICIRPRHEPGVQKAVQFVTSRYWPGK